MGVTMQNLSTFRDVQRRLDALARGRHMPELARVVGVDLMKQTQTGFRLSENPYGRKWAPVFRRRLRDVRARARRAAKGLPVRADKPLVDTGRMRSSVISRSTGTRVRIAIATEYASYHQKGTERITRRQMLPEADTGGLGPRWTMTVNKAAMHVLRKHYGEGR